MINMFNIYINCALFLKKAALRWLFVTTGFMLPFLCFSAEISPESVLNRMEAVADWQLNNPCPIDIHWINKNNQKKHYLRLGWDGSILRSGTRNNPREANDTPKNWEQMAYFERGNVSFHELPEVVQSAWKRESKEDDASGITNIEFLGEGSSRGWEMGALYHGLFALTKISKKPVYAESLRIIGNANAWKLGKRIYHADDHCVGYMYLCFYDKDHHVNMIADVQSRFDWILKNRPNPSMEIRKSQERWTWCDALFMAAPVWAKLSQITNDPCYREYMNDEWWACSDYLYSENDKLFFRDDTFFKRQEKNGQKVFWSRGNAWVLAALTLIIDSIPPDYPTRPKYIKQFQAMAARIAELQPSDGLWHSSLLDPDAYPSPESSSSAFFCYAFAWGVNNKLLDEKTYRPITEKTWIALQQCVNKDGRLGFIQQPGDAPGNIKEESSAPYGIGAFLLAGSEIYKMLDQ